MPVASIKDQSQSAFDSVLPCEKVEKETERSARATAAAPDDKRGEGRRRVERDGKRVDENDDENDDDNRTLKKGPMNGNVLMESLQWFDAALFHYYYYFSFFFFISIASQQPHTCGSLKDIFTWD
jgi:hypothetical protein